MTEREDNGMVLWTPEHAQTLLPALAVMLVLAAILRRMIGSKSLTVRMIPIQILAVMIVLLEIGKQITSFQNGYDLYHIPLHYCSLFIFTLPLMAFYRGKHRQTVTAVTATLCIAMTLLMLIYPALIYSDGNIRNYFKDFLDFHTVTFHNIVMLVCILIVALDINMPGQKGEAKAVVGVMSVFCVISAVMAQLLKTNYANFYSCNIPPLENLRLTVKAAVGSFVGPTLYVLIVAVLTVLFSLMCYWLFRLIMRLAHGSKPGLTEVR